MNSFLKKIITGFCICSAVTLLSSQTFATSLSLLPSSTSVDVNDTFNVDVVISDLGGALVGAFDLDVSFDSSVLSFNSYTLTDNLGVIPWDAEDWSFGDLGGGFVDVAEVSYLWDIDLMAIQGDSFTLATLSFTADAAGSSLIDLSGSVVGDEWWYELPVDTINNASVTVSAPVPEPATMLLLGTGLAGLAGSRVRRKKKA